MTSGDDVKLDEVSPEVPGDWRVDHLRCVACGAPPAQAPDLLGFGEKIEGATHGAVQCYFRKQPSTPEETARACRAAEVSCCNAVRYHGFDPAIRQRIPDLVGPTAEPEPRWPFRVAVRLKRLMRAMSQR